MKAALLVALAIVASAAAFDSCIECEEVKHNA